MILLKSEEPLDLKYIRSAVCFRLMQAPEYSVLPYVFLSCHHIKMPHISLVYLNKFRLLFPEAHEHLMYIYLYSIVSIWSLYIEYLFISDNM